MYSGLSLKLQLSEIIVVLDEFSWMNNATRKVHFVTKSCQACNFSQSSFSYVNNKFLSRKY